LSFAWGAKSPLTLDKTLVFLAEAGALLLHVEFMTPSIARPGAPVLTPGAEQFDATRRTV